MSDAATGRDAPAAIDAKGIWKVFGRDAGAGEDHDMFG